MHASAITATAVLLAGFSLGGAMASPDTNSSGTDANHLVRRANSCTTGANPESNWDVYLDNDVYYNKHCGNGCLDNIRGFCGDVTNWGCARNDAGQAHMTFSITNGCTSDHMTQALKKCTKGEQTIECSIV